MKPRTAYLAAAVCLAAASACSHSRDSERASKAAVERNDEIAITTRDGKVVLALTSANTVAMRLSDSLRHYVTEEIAKEFANDSADTRFGRWIQRTTANLVTKGIGFELSVPVTEIEDVRYEDGELRFEYRSNRKLRFNAFKNDGRSPLSEFPAEEAERFAEAVRAKISRG